MRKDRSSSEGSESRNLVMRRVEEAHKSEHRKLGNIQFGSKKIDRVSEAGEVGGSRINNFGKRRRRLISIRTCLAWPKLNRSFLALRLARPSEPQHASQRIRMHQQQQASPKCIAGH